MLGFLDICFDIETLYMIPFYNMIMISDRGRLWGPAPKWMWLQCHQNNRGPSHRRRTNVKPGWRGANCRKKDVFFSVRKKMLITSWSCWANLSCFSWRRGPRKKISSYPIPPPSPPTAPTSSPPPPPQNTGDRRIGTGVKLMNRWIY